MLYGDQWMCPCGTGNLFIRFKCRDCGVDRPQDQEIVPFFEVVAKLNKETKTDDNRDISLQEL